ncbi:hypothetical protein CPJCM30710_03180 [Clostridium polyendosporum]|uniref:DUF116 domain-containing protein n=1 Tax=Clostridium polyendosporum TaxID=69208 RepID=A0A919RWM3_9CLOT|nr:DUF116 domain-containing protein [Clostridium polyendosporum]GIM27652.1 hypothetical protein CPJCM30710_03180 [Clostridium polyendosporum]
MEEIITYSLRSDSTTSNEYYRNIASFTDEVLLVIDDNIGNLVEDYKAYIINSCSEEVRTKEEYKIEALMLGILWRTYISHSVILKEVPRRVLNILVNQREKNVFFKPVVDSLKGYFETVFLLKEYNTNKEVDKTIENICKLSNWLSASGDFKYEVKRLTLWQEYLNTKTKEEVSEIISKIIELAQWFKKRSEEKIGDYTKNVEEFLKHTYPKHKWKEDIIYCGRKRVEYHFNMVGAEIMNSVYRDEFLKTKEKRLLLPACMRFKSEKKCNAIKTTEGYLCTSCTSVCKIKELTDLGRKYDFKVYTIPHESTLFINTTIKEQKIGIVGVACVLNLISGGWKAIDIGFIPQCVLLDYCGCKNHWHNHGMITDINMLKLKDTFKIN